MLNDYLEAMVSQYLEQHLNVALSYVGKDLKETKLESSANKTNYAFGALLIKSLMNMIQLAGWYVFLEERHNELLKIGICFIKPNILLSIEKKNYLNHTNATPCIPQALFLSYSNLLSNESKVLASSKNSPSV